MLASGIPPPPQTFWGTTQSAMIASLAAPVHRGRSAARAVLEFKSGVSQGGGVGMGPPPAVPPGSQERGPWEAAGPLHAVLPAPSLRQPPPHHGSTKAPPGPRPQPLDTLSFPFRHFPPSPALSTGPKHDPSHLFFCRRRRPPCHATLGGSNSGTRCPQAQGLCS